MTTRAGSHVSLRLVSFIPVPFPFSSLGSVFHPHLVRNGMERSMNVVKRVEWRERTGMKDTSREENGRSKVDRILVSFTLFIPFSYRSPWLLSTFTSRKGSFMKVSIILGDRRERSEQREPRMGGNRSERWATCHYGRMSVSCLCLSSNRFPLLSLLLRSWVGHSPFSTFTTRVLLTSRSEGTVGSGASEVTRRTKRDEKPSERRESVTWVSPSSHLRLSRVVSSSFHFAPLLTTPTPFVPSGGRRYAGRTKGGCGKVKGRDGKELEEMRLDQKAAFWRILSTCLSRLSSVRHLTSYPPPLGSRLTSARRARLRRWDGYRGVEGRVNEWGVNEEPAWRENSERKNDGGEVKRATVRHERPVTYSARFVHPTHLSHLLVSLHSFREPKAVRGEEVKDERTEPRADKGSG